MEFYAENERGRVWVHDHSTEDAKDYSGYIDDSFGVGARVVVSIEDDCAYFSIVFNDRDGTVYGEAAGTLDRAAAVRMVEGV
mgnify:CR=1 FL=1|tara:strand:+ start:1502 stop:1747 length:246 start_codon:yes stop_codon:yes gene_type:complete